MLELPGECAHRNPLVPTRCWCPKILCEADQSFWWYSTSRFTKHSMIFVSPGVLKAKEATRGQQATEPNIICKVTAPSLPPSLSPLIHVPLPRHYPIAACLAIFFPRQCQCTITFFQYILRSDLGAYLYLVTNEESAWVRQSVCFKIKIFTDPPSTHIVCLSESGARKGTDTFWKDERPLVTFAHGCSFSVQRKGNVGTRKERLRA